MTQRKIFGFVDPSGSGKTTLILELLHRYPEIFGIVRSITTRPSRGPEDDRFFSHATHEEVLALKQAGRLFTVSEYAGHFYANDRRDVDALLSTRYGIMALVEQGVLNFRAAGYEVIVIRVIPEHQTTTSDEFRKAADASRAKLGVRADLEIINSFLPGGKEKALQEIEKFVVRVGIV